MSANPRGRKPGGPSQKRKADDELSSNPNTKKARDRMNNLSEERARYEKARKAFATAHSRERTRIMKLDLYQNASTEEQQAMIEQGRLAIEAKYIGNKRHPSFFETSTGVDPQELVDRSNFDDGDLAYEDVVNLDEADIAILEHMNRILNKEPELAAISSEEIEKLEEETTKAQQQVALNQVYSVFQKSFLATLGSMAYKIRTGRNEPSIGCQIANGVIAEWEATMTDPVPNLLHHAALPGEMFLWFLFQHTSRATLKKLFLPSKKCRRVFRVKKWSVLNVGHHQSSYRWAPTVNSFVQEIRGWGNRVSKLPKQSEWETLPGPAWIWDETNLFRLSVVYPYYEEFLGIRDNILKAIFDLKMSDKEKRMFIAFSPKWYNLFNFSMSS